MLQVGLTPVADGRQRQRKVLAATRVTFVSPNVETPRRRCWPRRRSGEAAESRAPLSSCARRVVWKTDAGLLVPVTAVLRVNGQFFAFVGRARDKGLVASQRPVSLGAILGNDYVVLRRA